MQKATQLRSRFILLSVLIFNFMLSYNYPTSEASAQSFSYMRQVIEDPVGDPKSTFTKNTTGKPVTYISTISSCLKNNSASLDI